MRKITVEGIEINFNDLIKQKQMELYEKNREKYKEDASKSIYSEIRKMVAKDETESSEFLNRMLRDEINGENNKDVMDTVFDNEIFEIEEETIRCLAASDKWQNRQKAAELSKDSKFLNQMLQDEINGKHDGDIIDEIFDNEFLKIEEETIICLAKSNDFEERKKAAELSKDSKFLNQMLRDEINGENYREVVDTIFYNEFFQIEGETIKCLVKSNDWTERKKAAELSKDPDLLLEMFVNEFRNYDDDWFSDVMEAIIENEAFVIEKTKLLEYIRDNY